MVRDTMRQFFRSCLTLKAFRALSHFRPVSHLNAVVGNNLYYTASSNLGSSYEMAALTTSLADI